MDSRNISCQYWCITNKYEQLLGHYFMPILANTNANNIKQICTINAKLIKHTRHIKNLLFIKLRLNVNSKLHFSYFYAICCLL